MSLKYFVLIEEIQKIKTFVLISKTKNNILSSIEEDILILVSKKFIYLNEKIPKKNITSRIYTN